MADRTYRSGRDRYDRERGYGRQAEQFDTTDFSRRDEGRGYGQMGDGWRDEDYGQFDTGGQSYSRDRETARDWGRDPTYPRASAIRSGTFSPRYDADRTFERGAGSQLAANHGEWRDGYGATPSRQNRDYRDTWGSFAGGMASEGRGWLDRASDTVAGWFGDDDDRRDGRGYRGHGPAGYTRSDDRIMEDACDALTYDRGVDARQISLTVSNGEVTLDGTVPSREHKRRAEDCIEDLSGVKHVQNNLRVQERNEFGTSQSNPTGTQA